MKERVGVGNFCIIIVISPNTFFPVHFKLYKIHDNNIIMIKKERNCYNSLLIASYRKYTHTQLLCINIPFLHNLNVST